MNSSNSKQDRLQDIQAITLNNATGDSVVVLTLGATVAEFNVRTSAHGIRNVVLGYPNLQSYLEDTAYLGVIAGRYCNRIANSRFSIGATIYQLNNNEGMHHLHGGAAGFHHKIWDVLEHGASYVTLGLVSEDGDEGYPGNLAVKLRYQLSTSGCLDISWEANSDKDTMVSLTNHSYFNLAGAGDIHEHLLRIHARHYTPITADLIPTGTTASVANTVFDLQAFTELGGLLSSTDPEIKRHGGLDHNWARGRAGEMLLSAELYAPQSGLLLQASSTLPGLQCYSGNHLAGNGVHRAHEGICLEAQYYPNSPNVSAFPSPLLRAGDSKRHVIRYQVLEAEPISP